jgi:F-type H+-transporting ATPase subunit gamma
LEPNTDEQGEATIMPSGKEIRVKLASIESTRKITKAMEMVAASKMRKSQQRMRSARPYGERIRNIAARLAQANPEYAHPLLEERHDAKRAGMIVVTTDKGLCGGINVNLLRLLVRKVRELEEAGVQSEMVAIGSKALGFLDRIGAKVVARVTQLGDMPHLERLIGPVKVLLDEYQDKRLDVVYIFYTRFVNVMTQETVVEQLLPFTGERLAALEKPREFGWDYLYEPDARTVIDDLVIRYVEALIYQSVAENQASEQAARRMAMKAATDNAGNVINELKLVYNKSRQAAITKEISEIVSGAAAV